MRLSASGWAAALLAAPSLWFLAPGAGTAATALAGPDFPDAVIALASLVQLSLAAWVSASVAIGVTCGSCAALRGLAPCTLRRALFLGTATALTLTPALADRAVDEAPGRSVNGLPLPDRPLADHSVRTVSVPRATTTVIVRPGDTLWAIATRALPTGASAADIARSVARWHAANRGVIGPDPDLILPSQHLSPPPAKDDP